MGLLAKPTASWGNGDAANLAGGSQLLSERRPSSSCRVCPVCSLAPGNAAVADGGPARLLLPQLPRLTWLALPAVEAGARLIMLLPAKAWLRSRRAMWEWQDQGN